MIRAGLIGLAVIGMLAGCAAMGFTSDPDAVKKQVSFDHDCPVDKVNIVDTMEGGASGSASFKIEACGQNYRYKRMGLTYYDEANGSPLDKK